MAEIIQIDYEQMSQISSKFANESQTISELLQRVQSSMQQLEDRGWIGAGADAFFAEMQGIVLPAVTRLGNALNDASTTSKQIAQKMRESEEQAQHLFSV